MEKGQSSMQEATANSSSIGMKNTPLHIIMCMYVHALCDMKNLLNINRVNFHVLA